MRTKRSTIAALAVVSLLILLGAQVAAAEVYTVTLHNGNTFLSKYRPLDASYDPNYIVFMTEVGNTVSLHKDDVADVVSETESQGFGVVINTTTVLIGELPNDAPTEEQALEAMAARQAQTGFRLPSSALNASQFGEPSTVGSAASGGLPVGFAGGFTQQPAAADN